MLDGVLLRIALNQNNSMLLIQRNFNTTFVLLLFSLLGTIFGVLGAMKSIMIVVEKRAKSISETLIKRQAFEEMIKTVDSIQNNFEDKKNDDEIIDPSPFSSKITNARHE
jgi:hypothetical protein